jgi:hypothetical protein
MIPEYGLTLEQHIMENHWRSVKNKSHLAIKGVWESRYDLPVTFEEEFENTTDVEPLKIPLIGGGFIKLGTTRVSREISLDAKFPTARGDEHMTKASTIVTRKSEGDDPDQFSIFCDEEDEYELLKFLNRFDAKRDVDWDSIAPFTTEHKIARAMCNYRIK